MEATSAAELPKGRSWQYEPKWDGFRCLAFRDGDRVELQSKAGKLLTRSFPDVVSALLKLKAPYFVLDGELVISIDGVLSFEHLLERMTQSANRTLELARERPAVFLVFDLLVDDKRVQKVDRPLSERRRCLEAFFSKYIDDSGRIQLTPMTTDLTVAQQWFDLIGRSLEGVIAKRLDRAYDSGGRGAMVKVKKHRSMECVVGGFTYASNENTVASLLLGLFDDERSLRYVGSTNLNEAEGSRVLYHLESIIQPPGFVKRRGGRFISSFPEVWTPVLPAVVAEVRYDRFTGGHFRHGTKFLRWRVDKSPGDCLLSESAN